MRYEDLNNSVGIIGTRRVVTSQMGSWKWQAAYRVTWYKAHLAQNGKVVWRSIGIGRKYSEPQLKRLGLWDLVHGGLHNRPVCRHDAIRTLGIGLVRSIESRGWSFGRDDND